MLKITPVKTDHGLCLQLDGRIAAEWVGELRACWRSLRKQVVEVAVGGVEHVDSKGLDLLREMRAAGLDIVGAQGVWLKNIIDEATQPSQQTIHNQSFTGDSTTRRALPATRLKSLLLPALLLGATLAAPHAVQGQTADKQVFNQNQGEQQESGVALPLTLKQAVQLALKQAPETQLAAIALATQRAEKSAAFGSLLPQATATSMIAANKYNLRATGMNLPGYPSIIGPYEVFGAGAGFTMPLFDLTLWRKYQAQTAGVKAAAAGAQSVREQVVTLVASQYLGCQKAQADVDAAAVRVELAQTLANQADNMLENGAGTEIDSLRAHVQLESEKQRQIVARATLQIHLDGLARLLNLKLEEHVVIADKLTAGATPTEPISALVGKALAARPEMASLKAQQEAQRRVRQAARESRLPTVGAVGSWGYMGKSEGSSTPSYTYAIAAYVPLFTGGRIHAENVKAELALQKLAREEEQLRQRIIFEVRAAKTQLEASSNEVKVAEAALKLAERELEQARDRFAAGAANNVEVSMAQDSLAKAEDGRTAALYREQQSRADLARAIGSGEMIYGR